MERERSVIVAKKKEEKRMKKGGIKMEMKEKSINSQRQICMGILAVFLAVAFCFLWGKVNVHAEETIYKGFYYETKEDGTIKITGYDTDQIDITDGVFTIPSQIEGKDVTEIGGSAFTE